MFAMMGNLATAHVPELAFHVTKDVTAFVTVPSAPKKAPSFATPFFKEL